MSEFIQTHVLDEAVRQETFPVCRSKVFLGHAGVTVLPKPVADAVVEYTRRSSENHQEFGDVLKDIQKTRHIAAKTIGARPEEIALLGPTSLGLSLFANGLPWNPGDELLCYGEDYPANVYPWMELGRRGVEVRYLKPDRMGEITPELVEKALTPKTRLVALASCNYLTGYRIDVDGIGRMLQSRGVLFSLDAIQTIGASPLDVEHVDFLSADAHKWMLGPLAIGIVFVKKAHFDLLRPTLLGAWNVLSPNFIAQNQIAFPPTAQRYEPGVLNAAGIYGLRAALEMIASIGIEQVHARIMELKSLLINSLKPLGFEPIGPVNGPSVSGITTFSHPTADLARLFQLMEEQGIVASLRHDRSGQPFLRFSPHFYNTAQEIETVARLLRNALSKPI